MDALPGIDIIVIDGVRKSGDDSDVTWAKLYKRAWDNLVSDVSARLQDKFFVDTKLISRESSQFKTDFNSSAQAAVKLTFTLSRYSRLHVISVGLWSASSHTNAVINFYDTNADGELLLSKETDLVEGRNTVNIDTDFEVDSLYVTIDSSLYSVKQTENKEYHGVHLITPTLCNWDWMGGTGSVEQLNGGGLNLKYNVVCDIEKFTCENINFFKKALWWRNGIEITQERRFTENLNQFTTMTIDRASELQEFYMQGYEKELSNAIKNQNIKEDFICFNCKKTVSVQTALP